MHMSDSDHSDTLSTISTVSSLTSSDRLDSPPPYSPPRIYAVSNSTDPAEDESLSSTLIVASSSTHEPPVSSPSSLATPSPVPRVHSPPKRVKSTRPEVTNRSNRSSPRARPPRTRDHPRHSPITSFPPPLPLIPSFPPIPPPSLPFPPQAPDPPANMYMGTNSWMHPAQGFSMYQSASPLGASQSMNFHGPAMPPQRFMPQHHYHQNIPGNMGMDGMEEMRRGMEDMRRTMQHDMEEMHNSMRQAHFEMNSAFHGRPRRHNARPFRRVNNSGNLVVNGNQTYSPDGPNGSLVINNGSARGSGMNMVSMNGNGVYVGQNSVVWGGDSGSCAVSVSSNGGGQAVSQTYVGSDGTRHTYNAYRGL